MIFLLIVLQVLEIQACNSIVKERNVYSTEGEYYKLDMNQIFNGCQIFHCDNCDDEIQIVNASKLQTRQDITYSFLSVVSNETHFIGLTTQQLVIYIKQEFYQIQLDQAYDLPEQVTCNNSVVMNLTWIIIDCYNNDSLIIYQFQDGQFQNYYNSSSAQPINSKFSIFKGQILLYAQYFDQYQILTSFIFNNTVQEYQNMSSLQNFSDFTVSYEFIYISNQTTISQYELNQSEFILLTQIYAKQQIQQISVYNSLKSQSECDQLIILLQKQPYLQKIFGCNNQLFIMNTLDFQYEPLNQITQVLCNENFIILKNDNQMMQVKNDQTFQLLYEDYYEKSFQLILSDFGNILYNFKNLKYSAFSLQNPSLIINATNQLYLSQYPVKIKGSKFNFSDNTNGLSQSKIFITTLSQNDTQIYVQFQPNSSHFFEDDYYVEDIIQYSGQLLNITDNKYFLNANFGNFLDTTIENRSTEINQYQFLQILYTPYFLNENSSFFQVYFNQSQLDFSDCSQQYGNCKQLNSLTIKNIINLQIGFNYMYKIIAGAQIDDKMIQCIYLSGTNYIQNRQVAVQQSIIQYLISYNSIIILQNSSIIIYFDCQQQQSVLLDQQQINKLFNNSNYEFNPINITMNIQYLSSVLYINNQSNILAVSILNSQKIIPISRINQQINSKIYGIYLVNNRLILSFFDNFTLNFEVWNVENIFNSYFEKNLITIITQDLISIQNDNQFLYVIFNSSNIYIYNPELSQHMALFQNLFFQNAIYGKICSTQLQAKNALLILNQTSQIIKITNQMTFSITPNFNNTSYYPQLLYNFTLQSKINPENKLTTLSQLLIYLYNFTIINLRNDTRKLTGYEVIHNNFNYKVPKGKNKNILDELAQISNCSQQKSQQISCNSVNFDNFYKTDLQKKPIYLYTYVNNYLVIQDNQYLQILQAQKSSVKSHNIHSFINQKYLYPYKKSYSNSISFQKCLISTSWENYLYSICQSTKKLYWLQFEIINYNIVNPINEFPLNQNFSNIQKINSQQFILDNYSLYYYNNTSKNCSLMVNYCFDFFSTSIHFLNQELIALLFINQYQMFYIFLNNNDHIITDTTQIKLELLSKQQIEFFEILLIQQQDFRFKVFLKTNSSLNYIIELQIVFTQNQFNIIFSQILRVIPQIPQYFNKTFALQNNVGSYINHNFLIMSQSYQDNISNISYYLSFQLYNLSDILIPNLLMKPILMIQQYIINSTTFPFKIYQQQQYSVDSNQKYIMYHKQVTFIFDKNIFATDLILAPILEEFNCQIPQDTIITDFLFSCQNNQSYANVTINLQFTEPPVVFNFIVIALVTFGILTFLIMYMLQQKIEIKLELG